MGHVNQQGSRENDAICQSRNTSGNEKSLKKLTVRKHVSSKLPGHATAAETTRTLSGRNSLSDPLTKRQLNGQIYSERQESHRIAEKGKCQNQMWWQFGMSALRRG